MMQMQGYKVIEYSNAGSESECENKVEILSLAELQALSALHKKEFPNDILNIQSSLCQVFNRKTIEQIANYAKPGDIVCHPFGPAHQQVMTAYPDLFHIETGIGYDNPYLQFRVYESYSHWHFIMGKEDIKAGSDYNWVVPNYFDTSEWTVKNNHAGYLLLFGRVQENKGVNIVKEIAKYSGVDTIICGTMDIANELRDRTANKEDMNSCIQDGAIPNLYYKSPVRGKDRDALLGNALAVLMPTRYIEPFGCSGIEGQLCGTPLIASDFGAFSETVGDSQFRCKTLKDWLHAVELARTADRIKIAEKARDKYSLETIGTMYDKVFTQISELTNKGWYTL
jgi:glycosyltransferase involved in cell wall biosynthesis